MSLVRLGCEHLVKLSETFSNPCMVNSLGRHNKLLETCPRTTSLTKVGINVIRVQTCGTSPGSFPRSWNLGIKANVRQKYLLADTSERPEVPLQRTGEPFLRMLGREK